MILLLFAYAKNELADLTPKQVSQLAKLVKEEFTIDASGVQAIRERTRLSQSEFAHNSSTVAPLRV